MNTLKVVCSFECENCHKTFGLGFQPEQKESLVKYTDAMEKLYLSYEKTKTNHKCEDYIHE